MITSRWAFAGILFREACIKANHDEQVHFEIFRFFVSLYAHFTRSAPSIQINFPSQNIPEHEKWQNYFWNLLLEKKPNQNRNKKTLCVTLGKCMRDHQKVLIKFVSKDVTFGRKVVEIKRNKFKTMAKLNLNPRASEALAVKKVHTTAPLLNFNYYVMRIMKYSF